MTQVATYPETVLDAALWVAVKFGCYVAEADHPDLPRCAGVRTEEHDPATCTKRGKHPAVKFSVEATNTARDIVARFTGNTRNYLVATRPSLLIILDADDPAAYSAKLAELGQQHVETFTVTSHGDRRHYWYRVARDTEVGNGQLCKGVDVRAGANGYVIGPGSKHATGGLYSATWDRIPVPAPDWLIQALLTKQALMTDEERAAGHDQLPDEAKELIAASVDGIDRSERFHHIVGLCKRAGMSPAATITAVTPWCKRTGKYVGRVIDEVERSWGKLDGPRAKKAAKPHPDLPDGDTQDEQPEPAAIVKELAELDAEAKLDRIHALITWLVTQDDLTCQKYRDAVVQAKHIKPGDWKTLATGAKRKQEEGQKATALEKSKERTERRLSTTMLLPSPADPMAVAQELLAKTNQEGRVTWWRGDFYRWTGTHWQVWSDTAVNQALYRHTANALYLDPKEGPMSWAPTRRKIADLREALGQGVLQRDEHDETDDCGGLVAFTNGVLDVGTSQLMAHTPERFNLHALDIAYDPDAQCDLWTGFLGEVLEEDKERIALLQEWFGYVLIGGTELQKIFSMFGPKRCGKGTVMRVLKALVGQRHTVSPTLNSLAGTFGLEPLVGKRLAMLGDVQWTGPNLAEVVEILLGISGEDAQTVNRKHRTAWDGTLPTRFMLAGNDRPRFRNASGALPGRMVHLQFRVSFFGKEDTELTGKLLAELSGIFNWSLTGWHRLQRQSGQFTSTELGAVAARDVERQAAPVRAFVEDCCAEDGQVNLDVLYRWYEWWRRREGLGDPAGKPAFSRDIQSAYPMVRVERTGSGRTGKTRAIHGLRLLHPDEAGPLSGEEDPGAGEEDPGAGTGPETDVDESTDVFPGQDVLGAGGAAGAGIFEESQSHGKNSTERMSSSGTSSERMSSPEVGATKGEAPAPAGPAPKIWPLNSENTGAGTPATAGPAPAPVLTGMWLISGGPVQTWADDLYDRER